MAKTTHGYAGNGGTPEYRVWAAMLARCRNTHAKTYKEYGGRGIRVAAEWGGVGGFEAFLAHIGPRPGTGFTIDRVDSTGNYEPGNVRWLPAASQSWNRRSNHMITAHGRTMQLGLWADILGVHRTTIRGRLKRGWSPEQAVSVSKIRPKPVLEAIRRAIEIAMDIDLDDLPARRAIVEVLQEFAPPILTPKGAGEADR